MKFDKGHAKLGGKIKGTPNKATRDQRELITAIIDKNIDRIQSWIEEVAETDPKRAFDMVLGLMEFSLPKLKSVELTGSDGKDLFQPTIIVQSEQAKRDLEKL